MISVTKVKALPGCRLKIVFSDDTRGEITLKDRLFGPMFEPLRDPAVFAQAYVDEFGAVCWPNGADLAPDALYERLTAAKLQDQQDAAKAKKALAKFRSGKLKTVSHSTLKRQLEH